jgi:hypothetical protein
MKKKHGTFFGFAVLLIAAMFTVAGCDTGNGPGGGGVPQTITYTGTAGDGSTYTLKITENTSRAAYMPQGGDSYELTITPGNKKSSGTITVSGSTFTLTPTGKTSFTVTISGTGITAISGTITFTDNTTKAGPGALTPGNGGDSNDPTGSVTVNNLPALPEEGFTVNVLPNPGYTISSKNNFQAAMTDSIAGGSNTASPVEILATNGWNNSGTYLVVVTINGEIRFKQGVSFSSGSATVDWNTLTRFTDLPVTSGVGDGTPGVLTIEGYTGNGTYVYIYNYSGSSITTQLQYGQILSQYSPMLALGDADNGTSQITLYEGNGEIPFDETGTFLVTIGAPNPARDNDIEQRFKAAVQFTNGVATITFNSMTWMEDLPLM